MLNAFYFICALKFICPLKSFVNWKIRRSSYSQRLVVAREDEREEEEGSMGCELWMTMLILMQQKKYHFTETLKAHEWTCFIIHVLHRRQRWWWWRCHTRISCQLLCFNLVRHLFYWQNYTTNTRHTVRCVRPRKWANATCTALMAENGKNEWIYVFSVECLWWAPFNMQCSRFQVMRWRTCISNKVVQVYFDTNTMMKWRYEVRWLGDRIPQKKKKKLHRKILKSIIK